MSLINFESFAKLPLLALGVFVEISSPHRNVPLRFFNTYNCETIMGLYTDYLAEIEDRKKQELHLSLIHI